MDRFNEERERHIFAGLRPMPTRWTIRGPAISSFLEQYGEIIDWLADQTNDTTVPAAIKSKARSLVNQLASFIFTIVRLLDSLYLVTNPMLTKIQSNKMSVQCVRRMIGILSIKTFQSYNNLYEMFHSKALQFILVRDPVKN
ncbi:Zinc finger MYM-type protein 1-like [Oopsacas minuta]|uniref:Zinc finger MYM-type protein 1-like n=1 Tax=Oopsacas minuta TaxID=111878 RepID=A0AAV7JSC8_9METZ|nr:Zinc finger MYM-type protein 1-like [Oopsacas minuta]